MHAAVFDEAEPEAAWERAIGAGTGGCSSIERAKGRVALGGLWSRKFTIAVAATSFALCARAARFSVFRRWVAAYAK